MGKDPEMSNRLQLAALLATTALIVVLLAMFSAGLDRSSHAAGWACATDSECAALDPAGNGDPMPVEG
jgi:hypothetical protein